MPSGRQRLDDARNERTVRVADRIVARLVVGRVARSRAPPRRDARQAARRPSTPKVSGSDGIIRAASAEPRCGTYGAGSRMILPSVTSPIMSWPSTAKSGTSPTNSSQSSAVPRLNIDARFLGRAVADDHGRPISAGGRAADRGLAREHPCFIIELPKALERDLECLPIEGADGSGQSRPVACASMSTGIPANVTCPPTNVPDPRTPASPGRNRGDHDRDNKDRPRPRRWE